MELAPAVLAASYGKAPPDAVDALNYVKEQLDALGAIGNGRRWSHLCGQCAHESMGFTVKEENLNYSPKRLTQVWPSRFPTLEAAQPFSSNPRALANNVYGGRMGNKWADDGFRYRGRGYIQLTGRDGYKDAGDYLGINLLDDPDQARSPRYAWLVAAWFLATRSRNGMTAFEWADQNDYTQVTKIINGGTHGLDDRIRRTNAAMEAIDGASS